MTKVERLKYNEGVFGADFIFPYTVAKATKESLLEGLKQYQTLSVRCDYEPDPYLLPFLYDGSQLQAITWFKEYIQGTHLENNADFIMSETVDPASVMCNCVATRLDCTSYLVEWDLGKGSQRDMEASNTLFRAICSSDSSIITCGEFMWTRSPSGMKGVGFNRLWKKAVENQIDELTYSYLRNGEIILW